MKKTIELLFEAVINIFFCLSLSWLGMNKNIIAVGIGVISMIMLYNVLASKTFLKKKHRRLLSIKVVNKQTILKKYIGVKSIRTFYEMNSNYIFDLLLIFVSAVIGYLFKNNYFITLAFTICVFNVISQHDLLLDIKDFFHSLDTGAYLKDETGSPINECQLNIILKNIAKDIQQDDKELISLKRIIETI